MAHDDTTLIGDIENAIVARLQGALSAVGEFNINENADAIRCPAINVALYAAEIRPQTRSTYRVDGRFYVTLVVANPRSEAQRRQTGYPTLVGAMLLLGNWRPTITEDEVTTQLAVGELRLGNLRKVLESGSRIGWTFEARATWCITPTDADALAEYIETIGLNQVLKPGDDTVDAEDVLSVGS